MGGPDFKNYPANNLRAQSVLCTARCFAFPLFLQIVLLCSQLGVVTFFASEQGVQIRWDLLVFSLVAVLLVSCPGLAIIYCACAGVYALNRNLLFWYAVTNGLCLVYFLFVIVSLLVVYASIDYELWNKLTLAFGYMLLVVLPLSCAAGAAALHGVALGSAMRLRGDLLYFVAAEPPGELDTEVDFARATYKEKVLPKGKQIVYWTSENSSQVDAIGIDTTGNKRVDHVLHLTYDHGGVGRVASVETVGPRELPPGAQPIRASGPARPSPGGSPSPAASSSGRSSVRRTAPA